MRLMREDILLQLATDEVCVYDGFAARSADLSEPGAACVSLTKLNQLWVADITFIRLRSEFVYLAVVLDAYSRRVIGWDLGRTLQAASWRFGLCRWRSTSATGKPRGADPPLRWRG